VALDAEQRANAGKGKRPDRREGISGGRKRRRITGPRLCACVRSRWRLWTVGAERKKLRRAPCSRDGYFMILKRLDRAGRSPFRRDAIDFDPARDARIVRAAPRLRLPKVTDDGVEARAIACREAGIPEARPPTRRGHLEGARAPTALPMRRVAFARIDSPPICPRILGFLVVRMTRSEDRDEREYSSDGDSRYSFTINYGKTRR